MGWLARAREELEAATLSHTPAALNWTPQALTPRRDVDEQWPWRIETSGAEPIEALVDFADYVTMYKTTWFRTKDNYIVRHEGRNGLVPMHREIMGLTKDDKDLIADHIFGVRHDNRRRFLRTITIAENNQNVASREGSSKHRGVAWDKEKKRWRAWGHKKVDGKSKTFFIGYFDLEEDAATAASEWRKEHLTFSNEERFGVAEE